MSAAIQLSVLGALEIRRDGAPLELGAPKQRSLVAVLALAQGWPVSVDAIVDVLWADNPPPGVSGTLQSYISQLRRVIEPDRAPRAPATVLVTAAPGYALRVPDEQRDAFRFEQVVRSARRRLQPLSGYGRSPVDAVTLERERAGLDAALSLWRGTPYVELGELPDAVAERSRLEELRMVAIEDRALAGLALGDHATVAAELEALTVAHPLRERLWALRAIALARSGRQADALEVLRRVRQVLDEELGIEPSAALRDLQTALLRQDQRLDWVAPPAAPDPAPPAAPAAEPSGAPPPLPPPPRRPEEDRVAPWPMVGRDAELAALVQGLRDAESGAPSFAGLTGEPGIGKSRLAAEVLLQARRRGAAVLVGRCTQDEGAPPLWPWKSVLEGVGADLIDVVGGEGTSEDEGGQFRAWERVTEIVRRAAQDRTTVVLLEDLHWADASTLRVLRLLVESATAERLLVLGTWRSHPAPSGALADVAETFARRHARRVELHGLGERDARTVFEAVADRETGPGEARLLAERTDGNPFFLVELARLAAERGSDVDLAGGELPTAVGEVIDRRLSRLPEATVSALRVAAVIGRRFDLPTLAAAAGIDEDEALDVVEPAQAAGLLRDHGIDHYLFAHALVRDRLHDGLSATRLARVHARVAAALSGVAGRETEEALHWRAAGPSYAAQAWRSAVAAGHLARRLHDHERAGALLRSALDSMADDPAATGADRYAVLMDLAEAHKWAVRVQDLVDTVEQAIEVGKELRDPEAVARAAVTPSVGVLWRTADTLQSNHVVLDTLRGSLERLPEGDGELRCRTLLALALELAGDGEEPEDDSDGTDDATVLADQGRAMALRIGDPELLMSAYQLSFIACWRPSTAADRLDWISDALRLAEEVGDESAGVVCGTLRAMVLGELGRVAQMRDQAAATRAEANRLRIAYGDLMLTGLDAVWLAVSGRFGDCEAALEHIRALGERLDHESTGEVLGAARMALAYWSGQPAHALPALDGFLEVGYPFWTSAAVYRWRSGDEAGARGLRDEFGTPPTSESQLTLLLWCHAAELALYLGDAALAAGATEQLLPFAGRPCAVGGAVVMGPVDAYLAMALHVAGHAEEAAVRADAALAQAAEWGMAVVSPWLQELRDRHGF